MIKKVFGSISIILITLFVFLYFRTGAHMSVEISTGSMPSYEIFFKKHIGPYHKILPDLQEVEKKMKSAGFECNDTFGYFLSDPAKVKHSKLVSLVGCIYKKEDSPRDLLPLPPKDVGLDVIGGNEFCYIGKFQGSPSLTALKVYPKLKEQAEKDQKKLKSSALEIYEIKGKDSIQTTVYLCTL